MRRSDGQVSRLYVPDALAPGATLNLPPDAAHHLARVLRVELGARVVLFDGGGSEAEAEVIRVDRHGVAVKVGVTYDVNRESPIAATLAQAISSGDRMDYTLQKAVELGVQRIQPLFSERSIVRLAAERSEKRVTHWRQVIISACEQCGRTVIPELAAPLSYGDWLAGLHPVVSGELRILLALEATARLAELPRPTRVTLLAGPEGGYTAAEAQLALRYGHIALRLGPRILRTETAALAALAAINTLWGDF